MTDEPPPPAAHPRDALYAARAAQAAARQSRFSALSRRISRGRLVSFLAGAAALTLALFDPSEATAVHWTVGAVGLATFAALVRWHESVTRRERDLAAERRVNERARLRLARRFAELPAVEFPPEAVARATARDLNLFGPASVAQWIGTVSTPVGRETLACWIGDGARCAEIVARQRAVEELAPELDFRQRLEIEGERLARTALATREFVAWAENRPWIERRPRLGVAAKVAVAASAATFLLTGIGIAPVQLWFLVLVLNFAWTWLFKRELGEAMAAMAAREGAFAGYAALLRVAASRRFEAPRLAAISGRLSATSGRGLDAATELARLHRLAELSDARRSSVHALLQAACAWDVLLLARIGAWQRRNGAHVGDWLAAAGELEVLAAFAGVRFDEPGWAVPSVTTEVDRMVATGLGHPLLADGARVGNDVEIGPRGRFLLVTGSNMSGKSTLLRAIGVNAILARAGAPVCATSFRMPPLAVETSGRIDDSLAEGVSFFLAELRRLKEVVERAAAAEASNGPRVLFLLDELLRGTNSDERRVAVAAIVGRLLDEGAIGALSTHDLELAARPELRGRFDPVHFRDRFEEGPAGPVLSFDYRLRPGLATTTNALVLLRLVGLSPPPAPN